MNGKDVFLGLRYVDSTFINEAEFGAFPAESQPQPKGLHLRRPLLIAAIVAMLLALGLSAYATGMFGILDRKVQSHTNPNATLININGYQGSNEYAITVEWNEYLKQCVKDGTNQYSQGLPEDPYKHYGAYSQEAKDMLDSLLEKYSLRMFTEYINVAGQTGLYDTVAVSGFLPASAGLEDMIPFGTVYDHFSMEFMDSADLLNGKNVPYDLFCFEKGVFFNRGYLNADAESFEEWVHTAKDGTAVTLDLSDTKSVMMAELDNCYIFVNIRSGSANNDPCRSSYNRDTLTKEDLESFADLFNFEKLNSLGT